MPVVVSAADLAARLPEFLRRVRGGETVVVQEDGEPVAQLSPLPVEGTTWEILVQRLARVRTSDASFAADLETIQASQPPAEPYPWASS